MLLRLIGNSSRPKILGGRPMRQNTAGSQTAGIHKSAVGRRGHARTSTDGMANIRSATMPTIREDDPPEPIMRGEMGCVPRLVQVMAP